MAEQVLPFESMRYYDVPATAATMIFEDEATFKGLVNLFVAPGWSKLSPKERTNYTQYLKEKVGDNSIARSLVGLATNPFVWLAFLTTPAAITSLRKGKRIFGLSQEYGLFLRENPGLARKFGLENAFQILEQSEVPEALHFLHKARAQSFNEESRIMGPALSSFVEKVRSRFGVSINHHDPITDMKNIKGAEGEAEMVNALYYLGVSKRWKDIDEKIPILRKVEETVEDVKLREIEESAAGLFGTPRPRPEATKTGIKVDRDGVEYELVWETSTQKRWTDERTFNQLLDTYQERYGLRDLIEATQKFSKDRAIKLIGNEHSLATKGIIELDPQKVDRLYSAVKPNIIHSDEAKVLEGYRLLEDVLGRKLAGEIGAIERMQSITKGEFKQLIRESWIPQIERGNYFPLNNTEILTQARLKGHEISGLKSIPATRNQTQAERIREHDFGEASSRAFMRTNRRTAYDPVDVEFIRKNFSKTDEALENTTEEIVRANRNIEHNEATNFATVVHRIQPFQSFQRYAKNTAETWAFNIAGSFRNAKGEWVMDDNYWRPLLTAQETFRGAGPRSEGYVISNKGGYAPHRRGNNSPVGAGVDRTFREIEARSKGLVPEGGWSLSDALYGALKMSPDRAGKQFIEDLLIPRILGRVTDDELGAGIQFLKVKEWAKTFADSKIGTAIEESGKFGKNFVFQLRKHGDNEVRIPSRYAVPGNIAKWLYVSHLGINLASVLMNATQPLLHAATWGGLQHLPKAYALAFKDLGKYTNSRMKSGKLIQTEAERLTSMRKALTHDPDDLGLSGSTFQNLDDELGKGFQGSGSPELPSAAEYAFLQFPMKAFEKMEWLNRITTAHLVDELYKAQGLYRATPGATRTIRTAEMGAFKKVTDEELYFNRIRDTRRMVGETQFGAETMNIPGLMLGPTKDMIPGARGLSHILRNPAARQFLNFPLRSIMGLAVVSKRIGGGERQFAGWELKKGAGYVDLMRMLGISAIFYEVGKESFGVDISRGLAASSLTDILGGERFFSEEHAYLPVPPVVDIPVQLIKGFATDDWDLLGLTIPRLLPGGVGLSRFSQFFDRPPAPFEGLTSAFQRKYTGWDQSTSDGYVPIFKGDGSFVEWRKGTEHLLASLGVPLTKHKASGEFDGWLMNNREEFNNARNEVLNAYAANNPGKAQRIQTQFKKKFGVPLTVTKQQMRSRLRNRQTPRTERILDRMPREVREQYTAAIDDLKRLGVPSQEIFEGAPTSVQRTKLFDRPPTAHLNAEAIKELRKLLEEEKKAPPVSEGSFTSFGSF